MRAEVFLEAEAELAEGPVWDERANELLWVDILRGDIHRTSADGTRDTVIHMDEHVGAIAMTESGGLVAATQSGFRRVDGGGGHPLLAALPDAGPNIRMNDGKCDPAGRFIAGTMAYDETPGAGALYSFDGTRVNRLLADVTISNGLAWSEDGGTMYYIDTPTRRIDAFDYDVDSGAISDRRPEVILDDEIGLPDGLAIDADGGIWVALWEGGEVHRYLDGRLSERVPLPVPRVTCPAFGGPGHATLYVTTAYDPVSGVGGGIYMIPAAVPGAPPSRFRPDTAATSLDTGS